MDIRRKQELLQQYLRDLGSVAVAFSGGVDSTYLLKIAHDVLGERVIAITARFAAFPAREMAEASAFCQQRRIKQVFFEAEQLSIAGFAQNPPNRCYLCKSALFDQICSIARAEGFAHVAEGSNLDDQSEYRPGRVALAEQGVKSPLYQAGLTKADIRALSRESGLPTWHKPSLACLVSRFPYGESLDLQKLRMVELAEQFLLDLGLKQVRVRYHHGLARIETDEAGLALLWPQQQRQAVYARLKEYGFSYVSLDLLGYRSGSMDEGLNI